MSVVKNTAWHHTSLMVNDLEASVDFYVRHFGFRHVAYVPLPKYGVTISWLGIFEDESGIPEDPKSMDARRFMATCRNQTMLALKRNDKADGPVEYANGNKEPYRGFGHIAVHTDDVYAASKELEENGVKFQKRPDEGNMKGLAFALSPEGTWIEIIKRGDGHSLKTKYNLSQTMLRVKDPKATLDFYTRVIGFKLISERHFEQWKFSLYFLQMPDKDGNDPVAGWDTMHKTHRPVLELTHNHGTEDKEGPAYYTSQSGDGPKPMFAQTSYQVESADAAADAAVAAGATLMFKAGPIAFVADPDGYPVEFIDAGFVDL